MNKIYKYIQNDLWNNVTQFALCFSCYDGINLECGISLDSAGNEQNIVIKFEGVVAYSEFNESDLMLSGDLGSDCNRLGLFKSGKSPFIDRVKPLVDDEKNVEMNSYLLSTEDILTEIIVKGSVKVLNIDSDFYSTQFGNFEF